MFHPLMGDLTWLVIRIFGNAAARKAGHKDWEAFAQKVQKIRFHEYRESQWGNRPDYLVSLRRAVSTHVDSVEGGMRVVPVLALLDAHTHDMISINIEDKRIRDAFLERMETGWLPRGREGEREFICSMTRVVREHYAKRG
ncbi:hypothetical protein KIPB_011020 [Kipferlia bialata]|uniref:Uncharacterized protein n=1 Tax=Kipferlia bialata TaxID=797122 RepID=A0A9K3GND8_9EUKA|nr:hypothetical protein KIPB_011020 [Kipferlia bialata]|eukprot:g11020.t1